MAFWRVNLLIFNEKRAILLAEITLDGKRWPLVCVCFNGEKNAFLLFGDI